METPRNLQEKEEKAEKDQGRENRRDGKEEEKGNEQ